MKYLLSIGLVASTAVSLLAEGSALFGHDPSFSVRGGSRDSISIGEDTSFSRYQSDGLMERMSSRDSIFGSSDHSFIGSLSEDEQSESRFSQDFESILAEDENRARDINDAAMSGLYHKKTREGSLEVPELETSKTNRDEKLLYNLMVDSTFKTESSPVGDLPWTNRGDDFKAAFDGLEPEQWEIQSNRLYRGKSDYGE